MHLDKSSKKNHKVRLSLKKIIPNMITLAALSSGLLSIKYVLEQDWEKAVAFIVIAGILDILDGKTARLLKSQSRFGAELDSLSDFLCFGAAPAILLYHWSLSELEHYGWVICSTYAICCSLRLARFNTMLDNDEKTIPAFHSHYFFGIPAPAGAGVVLLPLFLYFATDITIPYTSNIVAFITIIVAIGFISKIPTPSTKKVKISQHYLGATLFIASLYIILLITMPWLTLTLSAFLYIAICPLTIRRFLQQKRLTDTKTNISDPTEPSTDKKSEKNIPPEN